MSHPRCPARGKVLSLPDLLEALRPHREQGGTVVFSNGCYDLIHTGHLRLLEAAAGLGDLLVVGLNEDESIRRQKGPERPFISFRERAELLAALEVIDFVVGFGEDTPAVLIEAVLPDVLVKGGDWPPDQVVGHEAVESRGGRVVTIPLVPGHSSTALAERIRKG